MAPSRRVQRQVTIEAMAELEITQAAVESPESVELRVPADPAYLVVIRTATAGLAARQNLSIDEIEDLRIAVDEACSLLLAGRSHPGRTLNAEFSIGQGSLTVLIVGPAAVLPETANFSWSVLRALAGDVVTGVNDGGAWIRLTHAGRGEQ